MDWEFVGEVLILVIGLPLMWWLRRPLQNWPPEYEIESPQRRVLFRRALWAFMWSVVIFAATRLADRYGLLAPDARAILTIIVGVVFFVSAILIGWYRMTFKWD